MAEKKISGGNQRERKKAFWWAVFVLLFLAVALSILLFSRYGRRPQYLLNGRVTETGEGYFLIAPDEEDRLYGTYEAVYVPMEHIRAVGSGDPSLVRAGRKIRVLYLGEVTEFTEEGLPRLSEPKSFKVFLEES